MFKEAPTVNLNNFTIYNTLASIPTPGSFLLHSNNQHVNQRILQPLRFIHQLAVAVPHMHSVSLKAFVWCHDIFGVRLLQNCLVELDYFSIKGQEIFTRWLFCHLGTNTIPKEDAKCSSICEHCLNNCLEVVNWIAHVCPKWIFQHQAVILTLWFLTSDCVATVKQHSYVSMGQVVLFLIRLQSLQPSKAFIKFKIKVKFYLLW